MDGGGVVFFSEARPFTAFVMHCVLALQRPMHPPMQLNQLVAAVALCLPQMAPVGRGRGVGVAGGSRGTQPSSTRWNVHPSVWSRVSGRIVLRAWCEHELGCRLTGDALEVCAGSCQRMQLR